MKYGQLRLTNVLYLSLLEIPVTLNIDQINSIFELTVTLYKCCLLIGPTGKRMY